MDKSEMRVRPGFLLGLLAFFAFFVWLVSRGVPSAKDKAEAENLSARVEERCMAELLQGNSLKVGGLTNISDEFILNSFHTTNKYQHAFASHTNASGEMIDIWQTPYRIDLVLQTNFIVRSAGPNKIFGDKDDIIFNSVSNGFVKP